LPDVIGSSAATIFDPRSHAPLAGLFAAAEQDLAPTAGNGTGDYVHPDDVALAILEAVKRLDAGEPLESVYNLGSGLGTSAPELLAAVERATGATIAGALPAPNTGSQPDDAAPRAVASTGLAARDLDWRMRHPLDEMVATSWAARRAAAPA
jgi:UDP-glucose 4-epimerase